MSTFASWIYQIVLLLVATFAFMILFQYGTTNFRQHAEEELAWLRSVTTRDATNSAAGN